MHHFISRVGLCLVLASMGGLIQPIHAQSIAASTLGLPQDVNDIVWDPTRSRFFASSATSVLMINPETAQVEDTIPIGSRATRIATSDDGQYLYVSLESASFPYVSLGMVNRYRIDNHSLDVQIELGQYTGGNILRDAKAIAVLPGQPSSILVATTDRVMVFDDDVPRAGTAALYVSSLYVRPSDGAIFGFGGLPSADGQFGIASLQVFWFSVSKSGVALARSAPVDPHWNSGKLTWNGNLVVNNNPFTASVFDLNTGATIGRLPLPQSTGHSGACILATEVSGTSAIVFQYAYESSQTSQINSGSLVQYSLANFRPTGSIGVTDLNPSYTSLANVCSSAVTTWGTDGILILDGIERELRFLHASGLSSLTPAAIPTPTRDASGLIHLALPANGLVYDSGRDVLWASIPGNAGAAGNSVVSIDPGTGNVIDTIYAGSEPSALALSGDGSHLFSALAGAPVIASVDLSARQSSFFSVLDASSPLYWSAIGVAAIAAEANSVVAVRAALGGPHSSVVAYNAGVPRKNTLDNGAGASIYSQYVQTIFPADSANVFYAANTAGRYSDGTHDVYKLIVDSTGVRLDTQLNNLLLGSAAGQQGVTAFNQLVGLVYDAGRLFTSAGQIVTPDTKELLGSVAVTPPYGLPVPFSDQNGVVYVQNYLSQFSAVFYDLATFRPLKSVPLLVGPLCDCANELLTAAVRAGGNALAIAANGEIVIAPLASFQNVAL